MLLHTCASVRGVSAVGMQRRTLREHGRDMAARLKREREERGRVYPQHLTDDELRQLGPEDLTLQERQKWVRQRPWRDYMDEHGGVDFTEYIGDKFVGVAGPMASKVTGSPNMYFLSQRSNPSYITKERILKANRESRSGTWRRWERPQARLHGFRHVGAGRATRERRERLEETVEEKVVVNLPSPYKALGLPTHATLKQAAETYRKLAKTCHPDAPSGNAEKMAEVNEAYAVVRKIIKEGGPAKSPTAQGCHYETTERVIRVKRTKKERERAARVRRTRLDPISEEDIINASPRRRDERLAMVGMPQEFKSTLPSKEHRKLMIEEREERREYYGKDFTIEELNKRPLFILSFFCMGVITCIEALLPDESSFRASVWSKDDPCAPNTRV
eukprot:TRINITY_DN23648_c0_g1_i1.p1 TRINITY_DN23648_c0_g1~~TRINITY_DN23648_c0_g1_i1.p1  ORF type:complete len:389 (+),score=15.03 TRINITY_DN23648_c0_g1_i1:178-1344(+)